jgi:hypothetical protein
MKAKSVCPRMILISILVFLSVVHYPHVARGEERSSNNAEIPPRTFDAIKIAEKAQIPNPSLLKADSKRFCLLQHDNGMALTYFPNWNPGDKNAIYFKPQDCGVPYPFPFQITDVEFLLYNHAGVDSTRLRFSVWTIGAGLSSGPQTQIYSSPVYTVTTFYPNWALVSFQDKICVYDSFFFVIEYVSGQVGSIPSVASDAQQGMVNTFYQWLWYNPSSPPWREWNLFWNEPDPGWLMLRLKGETYSLACDTGWIWLGDNGYAPSGAPDVSENQNEWIGRGGSVAIGNCLEWFGVNASWGWSAPEFVDTLARYFQTDSTGTEVHNMKSGVDDFLSDFSVPGLYSSIWPAPDFYVMKDSLRASQTIVLLLGFWWWDGANWKREGGHFVTLSGIKPQSLKIALSDPGKDAAEYGWPGRVRPADHPPAPHDDTLHNNLQYISHDIYRSSLSSPSPGNPHWQLTDYLELDPDFPRLYTGKNFPTELLPFYQSAPPETTFVTEVEYAVMICSRQEHWWWEISYPDYAPSGMPDFDLRQDGWINIGTGQPTFSAPAAVANSFWWIDSKFNRPPGSMGDGMDQYPLVRDYLDNLSPYANRDDHDLWNVDHSATPWTGMNSPPPTPQPFIPGPQIPGGVNSWGELIERLAWQMDTDGQRSASYHIGTKVPDIGNAIEEWFSSETFSDGSSLSESLCVKIYQRPAFAFAESLVKEFENVILLLGFWYFENDNWWRVGGHYVTVAGVNSVQLMVAFSDPFFDQAETGAPGRVLSGSYLPHNPIPHSDSTLHNDPGNVSHDIYDVNLNSPAPAGIWWIPDYPVNSNPDSLMSIFYRQNVPDEFIPSTRPYLPGYIINTIVEYAILIDVLHYRGDVNRSGSVELGDIVFLISYLYKDGPPPIPLSTGDVNCDGVVSLGDMVFLISFLYRGGPISRCCGP